MKHLSAAPMAICHPRTHQRQGQMHALGRGALGLVMLACASAALAQTTPTHPVTSEQRKTAQQVAQVGVPLSELAPNAPERYTIKSGDTLWAISGLFLKSPWRWPELWGMNLQQIRNPHLIFPGQVLVLTQANGRATLTLDNGQGGIPTVKLSPGIRAESLADSAIPPIPLHLIEPFLTESMIVEESAFSAAPRIVAAPENRVLLSRGDRAYARGQYGKDNPSGKPLTDAKGDPRDFRVFRDAAPLKDPGTGAVLGYEAQFVGKARLVRGEGTRSVPGKEGGTMLEMVPATIDITLSKEEMRVGDRLLPEPPREVPVYVPRAPGTEQRGQIVAVHGAAVHYAGQNQIVVLNRGASDGLERGHVLEILKGSPLLKDPTDAARPDLRLPHERNGLMMVFRTFDKLSYALVLQITDGVQRGDRFVNP